MAAICQWFESSGALLLIADHMPFSGAANKLAGAYGSHFIDGFAMDTTAACPQCPTPFRATKGTLCSHSITQGIDSVATFTGQAFLSTVADMQPLLVFRRNAESLLPQQAWQFNTARPQYQVEAGFEAAMFTAKRAGLNGEYRMGMNASEATQNGRLLHQVMRWLVEHDE